MVANIKGRSNESIAIASLTKGQVNTEIIKGKIATKIISRRNELKMNQSAFARFMDVSQAMVSKWENGDCNFSLSTICEICDKLSLNIDFQITKEENYKSAEVFSNWDNIALGAYGIINAEYDDDEDLVA